jgi:hypothetical protein
MHKRTTERLTRPTRRALTSQNVRLARKIWTLYAEHIRMLKSLSREFHLSIAKGDLRLLDGKWYVTNSGLLGLARRKRCVGIHVRMMREFCDPASSRWVFKAVVYRSAMSTGFVGYGDADRSNVSALVRGAEMRVAETRSVNRALRKAYGIGLCSVEELGSLSSPPTASLRSGHSSAFHIADPSTNGHHPRLRDQLCLLIRQHNLDPALVKAYAADFCGTETLKEASRDLVESFISHLAASAKNDRDALICKLNSYAQSVEVQP